jgi:hypothetical protein
MNINTNKICVECKNNEIETSWDSLRNIYLCIDCKDSNKYKLICKTDIRKEYFINPNLMTECINYTKSVYGHKYETILYRICDVLDKFCIHYNIDRDDEEVIIHKLEELERKRDNRRMKIRETMENKRNKRKQEIINGLAKYKLELRNDSKLCQGYIDNTIKDWTINEIVNRMCQMKYLFDYCNMDYYLGKAYQFQKDEINDGYYPDCSVFEKAELMALKKVKKYPKEWPWMKVT